MVSVGSTPVRLDNIDLHVYIVVGDGRAYTAISEVPEPLGWALMPVTPIGGLFGYLFALKLPGSQNGFNITGKDVTKKTLYGQKVCLHLMTTPSYRSSPVTKTKNPKCVLAWQCITSSEKMWLPWLQQNNPFLYVSIYV